MKFVCDGSILADAAFTVCKACATRTMTPILECIKIKAQNDGLTLTAYDGEIAIEKKMKADVMDEGEVCVNGKFFSDFVGKITLDEVLIDCKEQAIMIKYGENESYMQTLAAKDFPVFDGANIPEDKYIELKQTEFKELVSKVTFCCATDDSRPILKGSLLETKDGELYASALDGFRMASGYAQTTGGGDMKIVVPARTLTEISRMLEGDELIKIFADKNRLSVAVKDTVITSRLYLGEFVKKENIFPKEFTSRVTLKKSELIDSVERASVVIRGDKNNLLLFDIKAGKMVVNANSDIGKIEETVAIDLQGKELKIAMNGKYLLDALKALDEEEIVMSLNSSVAPLTVENMIDKRFQYLILPVRTSNSAQ